MNQENGEEKTTQNKESRLNKPKLVQNKLSSMKNKKDTEMDEYDANFEEKKKTDEIFKRFLIRLFVGHLGVYVITAAYIISGAFLFQLLEKQNFIENCQTGQGKTKDLVKGYRLKLFNYVYFNTTNSYLTNPNATNILDTPNVYGPVIKQMLIDFRDEVLKIQSTYKYYGQDCFKENLWSFESSFLLTITIVSTLGYGHITPTTWQGQIVCICYATIGIPIFLMAINNISTILSNILTNMYSSLICCEKKYIKDDDEDRGDVGNKKIVHDEKNGLKIEKDNTCGVIGSNFEKNTFSSVIINDEKNVKYDLTDESEGEDEDEDEDEEEEEEETEKINVPLIIILIILGSYLYIGALVFTRIEKWTTIQASYYAFISVATIGLGDLVPGLEDLASGREKDAADNLLIAIAFVFIGIAILGMCFKLIQDTLTKKTQLISNLIGAISEKSKKIAKRINKTTPIKANPKRGFTNPSSINDNLNGEILLVKPISSSRLIENDEVDDIDDNKSPIPVVPRPTITLETQSEIIKFNEKVLSQPE